MEMEEILVSDQVEHHQNSLLMDQHDLISDQMLLEICSIALRGEISHDLHSVLQGKYSLRHDESQLGEMRQQSQHPLILSLVVLDQSSELQGIIPQDRLLMSHEVQFRLPMYKLLSQNSILRRLHSLHQLSLVHRLLRPQLLVPIVLRLQRRHS